MRLYLGAAQPDAGQAAEAEATFRQDLEWKQQSGWSTFGLYQAIEAQGRSAEAEIVKRQFESFWRNADVTCRGRISSLGFCSMRYPKGPIRKLIGPFFWRENFDRKLRTSGSIEDAGSHPELT